MRPEADGRTLYIGPQVALINDQESTLQNFGAPFEDGSITQYTGALSTTLSTRALYLTLPPGVEGLMQTMSGSFEGGLHAAQYALVATIPLVILCDRCDVESVSTTAPVAV